MRGDVVFFRPHDLVGQAIAKVTHGPFSHVGVALGDGTIIAADWGGIRRYSQDDGFFVHLPEGAHIEDGLAWLEQQVGLEYGIWDVIDAACRLLFHLTLYVGRPRSYDCSDLVTRYLLMCGLSDWLGDLGQEPHLVTPNDLARKFGL